MNEKRKGAAREFSSKGQITIFLILGVIILFAFVFVYLLSSGIQKGQLLQEKENVISKALKKESLRIFVEDCLYDEMTEGLSLLGKQGRIWKEQGGQIEFVEGVNGLTLDNGDRVAYAITDERYSDGHLSAYPCNSIDNYPEYCLYSFPNIITGFGTIVLRESTLERDLESFLLQKTKECVRSDIYEEVSETIKIDEAEAELTPTITKEGIVVKVYYPLRLELAGEEFFQVSSFDFFYKSRLQDLLEAAISKPVQWDQKYVDFDYSGFDGTKESFEYKSPRQFFGFGNNPLCDVNAPSYTCSLAMNKDLYDSLAIEKEVKKIGDTGDTVLSFTTPDSNILTQPGENPNVEGMYQFRVARQNRSPALDYIGRNQCLDVEQEYDYLVIPGLMNDDGSIKELSKIDIHATARDADEGEEPTISFEEIDPVLGDLESPEDDGVNIFKKTVPEEFASFGIYHLTVVVSDKIKEDNQTVRILIDRPIETGVWISLPYRLGDEDYITKYPEGSNYFPVSKEDPVFVYVKLPDESAVFGAAGTKLLTYKYKPDEEEIVSYDIPMFRNDVYSFPGIRLPSGELGSYGEDDIISWDITEGPLNPFSQETGNGELSVSFGMNYCGLPDKVQSKSKVRVEVAECIPHINPDHPFAYPNHNYYAEDGDLDKLKKVTDNDENAINPFLATHSCCSDNWEYVEKNDPENPCFVNPEPGCYGQIKDFTTVQPFKGLVQETQVRLCSGNRGNICDGDPANTLINDILTCGVSGQPSCGNIPPNCQDKPAFSFVTVEESVNGRSGWCSGTLGCQNYCTQPVAFKGNVPDNLAEIATERALGGSFTTEANFPGFNIQCGCTGQAVRENWDCDSDHNGVGDGFCIENGVCGQLGDRVAEEGSIGQEGDQG